jgi:hypothetical protein
MENLMNKEKRLKRFDVKLMSVLGKYLYPVPAIHIYTISAFIWYRVKGKV